MDITRFVWTLPLGASTTNISFILYSNTKEENYYFKNEMASMALSLFTDSIIKHTKMGPLTDSMDQT